MVCVWSGINHLIVDKFVNNFLGDKSDLKKLENTNDSQKKLFQLHSQTIKVDLTEL